MSKKECECMMHRYHVVHVCPCGQVVSHSQGDWDAHRRHEGTWINLPSYLYEHGDTAEDVIRKREQLDREKAWKEYQGVAK